MSESEVQIVVLKVGMSSRDCLGDVKRVLEKMDGLGSFEIDLKSQKVTVQGYVQPEEVLQAVLKTGKKTSFWEVEEPKATIVETEAVVEPADNVDAA